MHRVAHGGAGAAVPGDGLYRHGGSDMVFAHAAQLLRDDEAEQPELGERFEIFAREEQLLVGFDRVVAQCGAGEVDDLGLQLLLLVGQQPLGIPLITEAPKVLFAPFFRLAHDLASSPSGFFCRLAAERRSLEMPVVGEPTRWAFQAARICGPFADFGLKLVQRSSLIAAMIASGASSCIRCPDRGTLRSLATGIIACSFRPWATGIHSS